MRTLHIGYSGTRMGMSEQQTILLRNLLQHEVNTYDEAWLHHGLCRGGDSQAHQIAKELGYKIWGHPALDKTYQQAHLEDELDQIDFAYSYHGRNQRICMATNYLIAAPLNNSGEGGTWWTINCMRRMQKQRIILHRLGDITKEEGS